MANLNVQKGQHVFLTLKSGNVYEGDVVTINHELKRVRLENITTHPENVKLESHRKFDFDEIVQYRTFDEQRSESTTTCSDKADDSAQKIKITEEEYKKIIELQKNYRYIKACDTNFYSAIGVIEKSNKIGIDVEDSSSGRKNRASVIAVSTNDQIFLFDIEVMGDSVFDKGLRTILESENIVKIVHDSRLLSDCLKEKHLVDLKNVLDVEAQDVFLVYQNQGRIRSHSRSLNYLTEYYLGIPRGISKNSYNYKKRPLEVECQDALATYVSFLIPLQNKMESVHLDKLKEVSEFYNMFWRRGDSYVFPNKKYTPKNEFKEFLRKKVTLRGHKNHSSEDEEQKNED